MKITPPQWLRNLIYFEIFTGEELEEKNRLLSQQIRLEEEEKERIKRKEKEHEERKKQEENKKQKDLLDKLLKLISRLEIEFNNYPFIDKYYVKKTSDCTFVKYKFENGDVIAFNIYLIIKEEIELNFTPISGTGLYITIKGYYIKIITDLLVKITNKSVIRHKTSTNNKAAIDNTIKDKYNLIVSKIKMRQDEINKLDKNSSMRESLVNELNTYKRKADELKKQF